MAKISINTTQKVIPMIYAYSTPFHAPMEVIEIIQQFTAVQEPKSSVNITLQTEDELFLDKSGEVSLTDDYVIGKSTEVFGEKIFDDVPEKLKSVIDGIQAAKDDEERGFSRTIPSFLMAYGDDGVTLATFDRIIPDDVFIEVTSISLDQFRFLRDGGPYMNEKTGQQEIFAGKLFDPVVFDDSVKEFLHLRVKLANYFEESHTEDIFDYIPPQKTNQIFTPKWVVKQMVDMLEKENPGCFDMPDKTFIDLYMKSGLYIAEIVKRLYQSDKMKEVYPDEAERLKHIFKEQVYGIAPTEIIYRIATNFILGFDDNITVTEHNFRQADALEYAKQGTLVHFLDELYGGDNNG